MPVPKRRNMSPEQFATMMINLRQTDRALYRMIGGAMRAMYANKVLMPPRGLAAREHHQSIMTKVRPVDFRRVVMLERVCDLARTDRAAARRTLSRARPTVAERALLNGQRAA